MIGGFSRSIFGIFFGLLLHRNHAAIADNFGKIISPWLAVSAIALILASPCAGPYDFIVDALLVIIAFPILVFIASQGSSEKFQGLLIGLGVASYPIYVLHKPVGEVISYGLKNMTEIYAPLSGMVFVLALVFASIWFENWWDFPLRRKIYNRIYKEVQMTYF